MAHICKILALFFRSNWSVSSVWLTTTPVQNIVGYATVTGNTFTFYAFKNNNKVEPILNLGVLHVNKYSHFPLNLKILLNLDRKGYFETVAPLFQN